MTIRGLSVHHQVRDTVCKRSAHMCVWTSKYEERVCAHSLSPGLCFSCHVSPIGHGLYLARRSQPNSMGDDSERREPERRSTLWLWFTSVIFMQPYLRLAIKRWMNARWVNSACNVMIWPHVCYSTFYAAFRCFRKNLNFDWYRKEGKRAMLVVWQSIVSYNSM